MIKVMKQALEALHGVNIHNYDMTKSEFEQHLGVIENLRAAIEQMEKAEPVAFMCSDLSLTHKGYSRFSPRCEMEWNIPVYTHPAPLRELSDEEIESLWHTELDNRQLGSIRAILKAARGQ